MRSRVRIRRQRLRQARTFKRAQNVVVILWRGRCGLLGLGARRGLARARGDSLRPPSHWLRVIPRGFRFPGRASFQNRRLMQFFR
jgi:hypothetical protein